MACPNTEGFREVESQSCSSYQPRGIGNHRGGILRDGGRKRHRAGGCCFHFTSTVSPRNVLRPNQIPELLEGPVYPKPKATPTSESPLTVPKDLSSESGQEALKIVECVVTSHVDFLCKNILSREINLPEVYFSTAPERSSHVLLP